ncbi:MAG TPA: FtsX-like permease family protein [Solirubrobacteraceae bacterium]
MSTPALVPSKLLSRDILRVGSLGLRSRRARAALSGLGVAIGIAALVAVLGISSSSQANLLSEIEQLGTNLLTVQPGQSFGTGTAALPDYSTAKVRSMPGVYATSSIYTVSGVTVRRSSFVSSEVSSGISVDATGDNLPQTLSGSMAAGQFLSRTTDRYATVVLGAVAAERLGIDTVTGHQQIYLSGRWFTLIGILKPLTLAPEIDRAALIGLPAAKRIYHIEPTPSTIYLRAENSRVNQVDSLLAATANPKSPSEVQVSRPSDTLQARAAAKGAFTGLLVGLGLVALFVGAVGIANVMVISVLERRSEIGLRRALGATRHHIASQFITESLLLGLIGGIAGVIFGSLATVGYAFADNLPATVPADAIFGGLAAALITGALAGLYPAIRASQLSPTQALKTV